VLKSSPYSLIPFLAECDAFVVEEDVHTSDLQIPIEAAGEVFVGLAMRITKENLGHTGAA
jgi:hypothetical protein